MKASILSLALIIFTTLNQAQVISNGDFEQWEEVDGELRAAGWDNSADYFQDSTGNQLAHGWGLNGGIWLSKKVIVDEVPEVLKFRAWHVQEGQFEFTIPCGSISNPQYACLLTMRFYRFSGGLLVDETSLSWNSSVDCGPGFRCFEVPGAGMDCDSLRFSLNANIWNHFTSMGFDDFQFEDVTAVSEFRKPYLKVFPNPTSSKLFIDPSESGAPYSIYNCMGKLLSSESYQSGVDVSELPSGNYFIELQGTDGIIRRSRFLVE